MNMHIAKPLRDKIIIALVSALLGGAVTSAASALVIVDRLSRVESRVGRIERDVLSDSQLRELARSENAWIKDRVEVITRLTRLEERLQRIAEAVARIDERTGGRR